MNLKSAARRLGVHYQTAYRWVRSGQLLAVKVGSGYEVSEAALEQFEVRRAATQRLPQRADPSRAVASTAAVPSLSTQAAVLQVLDHMADEVTLDARAVVTRAVRMVADVLGDGAIVYWRNSDGVLAVSQVAHRDPVSEVVASTVAHDVRSGTDLIAHVIKNGESIFVPQVPQRELRKRVHPEQHMHMMNAGCYSAICVPMGDNGALVVTRDVPGRPYTREDLAFVESVSERVARASVRADRWVAAHDERRALLEKLADVAEAGGSARDHARADLERLLERASDDPQAVVALLDLELRHLACTKEYAVLLGEDPTRIVAQPLSEYLPDLSLLEAVLSGELDFRSEDLARRERGDAVTVHAAMLRRRDATPWAVLVVAHATLEASSV